MSALINRVPTGRLISLHTELVYLVRKFQGKPFTLTQMKYDPESKINQLDFFPLAKTHKEIGKYDPYLDNPLSPAKFHLTQSTVSDTQKSKSVSECMNALEGLGWAERVSDSKNIITELGVSIAKLSYNDPCLYPLLRESVLGYGPFVGFLYQCAQNKDQKNIVRRNAIQVGYVDTRERHMVKSTRIPLSTGSQKDSMTRSKSALFSWAITTGFALPYEGEISKPDSEDMWHVKALDEIIKTKWTSSKFEMFIPSSLFNGTHFVRQPLSYLWMTKSTKALRERGQATIRGTSLSLEQIVKNRRFAIVYILGRAANTGKKVNFNKLVKSMEMFPKLFVINPKEIAKIIKMELGIAPLAGIPYKISGSLLQPLTVIDLNVVTVGAPNNVLKAVEKISTQVIE